MTGVLVFRTRALWRRRWPSLLAIALLVTLVLSVTVTAVSGARRTKGAPARFMAEDGTPDVTVSFSNLDSLRGIEAISNQPLVRDVSVDAGMAMFPPSGYMPIIAPVEPTAGSAVMRGVLLAGRRPDPAATDEIALSEGRARVLGAHVGGALPLVALSEAEDKRCLYASTPPAGCARLLHEPRLSVRIVGIVRTGPDLNNRVSDITPSTLSAGFFARYRSAIAWTPVAFVRLRPGASPDAYVAAARRALPANVDAQFDLVNASATFDAVDVLSTGLLLFALVAGLAGAFAIGQAVVRQVRTDDEERAVLAVLGETRRARFVDALAPVCLATILGLLVAAPVTYLASRWMPIGFARRVDPRGGRELDLLVLGAAFAVCLAVVAGGTAVAFRSSRKAGSAGSATRRMSSLLAASSTSPSAAVGLHHACAPGRGRRAVPVRSAVVGVAAATAGIVGVLGFSAGLAHLVDSPRLYGWTYDLAGVDVAYSARVVADPAVSDVADVRLGLPVRVNDRPTFAQIVDPIVGAIGPAIVAGRAPLGSDEVALGLDTLRAARAHLGDSVVVAGSKGQHGVRVVGQAVFPTGADAYPLADGAVFAPRALAWLGDGDANRFLAIRLRPGADRAAAFARLDALDAQRDPGAEPPQRPQPPGEVEKLQQVRSLPTVLAAFLVLLGAIALAHALVIGVRRRARDFAVLRVLGFRRRDAETAVAWEAGVLAAAGGLIGIPAGIVIGRLAWARTARGVGVLAVHRMPVAVVLVVVPAAVVLAIMIAIVPARRAARMRPAEILRSE